MSVHFTTDISLSIFKCQFTSQQIRVCLYTNVSSLYNRHEYVYMQMLVLVTTNSSQSICKCQLTLLQTKVLSICKYEFMLLQTAVMFANVSSFDYKQESDLYGTVSSLCYISTGEVQQGYPTKWWPNICQMISIWNITNVFAGKLLFPYSNVCIFISCRMY